MLGTGRLCQLRARPLLRPRRVGGSGGCGAGFGAEGQANTAGSSPRAPAESPNAALAGGVPALLPLPCGGRWHADIRRVNTLDLECQCRFKL